MKKLCKSHHLKYEHKLCKAHVLEHGIKICKSHFVKHEDILAKSEMVQEDSCPYCKTIDGDIDNDHSDCKYCQEYDSQQGNDHSDCPMCLEYDAKNGVNAEDDCPYCQEQNQDEVASDNESLAQQGIAADDSHPSSNGPDNCPECQKMYGDALENQPGQTGQEPPKTQGHETAQEVLDMLDQEPGQGEPPAEEAKQIDNTELPQGDAMEDGTSVPENFGDSHKQDISDEEQQFGGDSEDHPDMASVLQSGLDDHANEQKKAEVVDMVAQTLQGFKANKEFLEASKEQNPGLYQSTIQMLKAMISLCELLGLQPKMPGQDPMQAAPQSAPQASPDMVRGAAPQQEGQPDPKAMGRQVSPQ
jgi:hypothetical protein